MFTIFQIQFCSLVFWKSSLGMKRLNSSNHATCVAYAIRKILTDGAWPSRERTPHGELRTERLPARHEAYLLDLTTQDHCSCDRVHLPKMTVCSLTFFLQHDFDTPLMRQEWHYGLQKLGHERHYGFSLVFLGCSPLEASCHAVRKPRPHGGVTCKRPSWPQYSSWQSVSSARHVSELAFRRLQPPALRSPLRPWGNRWAFSTEPAQTAVCELNDCLKPKNLRDIIYIIIHPFKVYNSMVLSVLRVVQPP